MNSTTKRRELRACFIAALAYLVITWICVWLLKHSLLDASIALRVLVSLLPLVSIGFAVRAVVNLVRVGDELQRRIDVEALAIAAVLAGTGYRTLSSPLPDGVVDFSASAAMAWLIPSYGIVSGSARFHAQRGYQ